MSAIKHTILYVEDDLDDLFMVQQAFEKYDQSITELDIGKRKNYQRSYY